MRLNSSIKAYTMVATSVPEPLANKIRLRADAEMNSMSDHIRIVTKKWIEAGSPIFEVEMERFRVPLGAYFEPADYNRLKDLSLRRKVSIAQAVRIAMVWYHGGK